jgi:hypothetical protein
VTDRDVRRGSPPEGGRTGRPEWWSARAPDTGDPPDRAAGFGAGGSSPAARGPGQSDGWTNPAPAGSHSPAYGAPGSPGQGAALSEPARPSAGPYGGAPGFAGRQSSPGAPDAGAGSSNGYGLDRSAGAFGGAAGSAAGYGVDRSAGPYGGAAGSASSSVYGGSDATQVQPGSSAGWAPPSRSGAYGGAAAATQVQNGGWGAPSPAASAAPPQAPPTVAQNPGWPPSQPPGPAFAPSGQGYGAPPGGYGARSAPPAPVGGPTVSRHRPGIGLILGLAGAAALVLSLTTLPWISGGGQDVSFSNIREAYEHIDDRTESPLTAGTGSAGQAPTDSSGGSVDPSVTSTTAVEGGGSLGVPVDPPDLPSTDQVVDDAENTGKNTYLEFYTKWGWIGVLAGVSLAILFTTLVVPSNKAGRMLTCFFTAGMLGLLINAADDEGKVAPRVCGALMTLAMAGLHGVAIWALFSEDLAPDPAVGVWAGAAGLAAVLVGCIAGTRHERVSAYG